MSFLVKTPTFTGPFDLLLSLINRDKVAITEVNIASIADQYLEKMKSIGEVDLEVASDFVFVAATLLVLKSGYLLPVEAEADDDFMDEIPLSQEEALQFLVDRLARYRTYREAAKHLGDLEQDYAKKVQRIASLPEEFREVQPDHLGAITLSGFCATAASVFSREPQELLASEHIAKKRISLAHTTEMLLHALKTRKAITFSKLIGTSASPEEIVVNFLAVLDLVRQGKVVASQDAAFNDIAISSEVG